MSSSPKGVGDTKLSQSAGPSRPSEANCADRDFPGADASESDIDDKRDDRIRKLERKLDELDNDLAMRAVSVVPNRRLRRECVREMRSKSGAFKGRLVRAVLKAFLKWATEQLNSELVFESDEGDTVKANLPVSISEEKAKEYYARLKDMERALVRDADRPHTAMLTFTGSSENANGDPRCPADHMREVQASWDRVRRELTRVMDNWGFDRYRPEEHADGSGKWWEYATVLEPHDTGYAHFHVAVFTSEPIHDAMFEPVMRKHVEVCDIASADAHQVGGDDAAVSVSSVDPTLELDDLDDEEMQLADISNLGSYLAEYIGAFGDDDGEFIDRPVHELVFYAVCWATNTQRVRFSVGANKLAKQGKAMRTDGDDVPDTRVWDLKEIERPDGDTHPPHTGGGVEMVEIQGAPGADPPKVHPPPGVDGDENGSEQAESHVQDTLGS